MAWEYRKNCVDCGIERLVIISGSEAEAIALADNEAVHGRCGKCYEKHEAEVASLPSTEKLFEEELAEIGRLIV